jgi:hypothetical protein
MHLKRLIAASVAALVLCSPAFAQNMNTGYVNGGVRVPVTPATPLPVTMGAAPTGAATSANQSTEITALGTLHTDMIAPTPAGTNIVGRVGIDQTTQGTTNGVAPLGTVAHSAGATANPLMDGCRVKTTNDTTLVNLDASYIGCTSDQAVITFPYAAPDNSWNSPAPAGGLVNSVTPITMVAASGAGVRRYVTSCQLGHDALSAPTELVIRDATAAVLWRARLQIAAVETVDIDFLTPLRGTLAGLLDYTTLTAVTGAVYLNCTGVNAP